MTFLKQRNHVAGLQASSYIRFYEDVCVLDSSDPMAFPWGSYGCRRFQVFHARLNGMRGVERSGPSELGTCLLLTCC